MKRYTTIIAITLLIAQTVSSLALAATPDTTPEYEETYLVATAYYSPLPGQKYYLRGNFEKEVILNGKGTHGASGKPVFTGMLAAPKTYTFGTRIWVDGLGVGSVEDRWGAIVNAGVRGHAYDRIDIWMGSGEEGLARSLAWGKRTVKARIYTGKSSKVAFSTAHLSQARLANSVAKPAVQVVAQPAVQVASKTSVRIASTTVTKTSKVASLDEKLDEFNKIRTSLGSELGSDSVAKIRNTQNVLRTLGYMKTHSTGTLWPSTLSAIRAFEESRGVMLRSKKSISEETRKELAIVLLARGIESVGELQK